MTGFKDGNHANESTETTSDWETFSHTVEDELLEIPKPRDEHAQKYQQPVAYFTPNGVRLERDVTQWPSRIVFVFEGGQFIWPGVRVGHTSASTSFSRHGDAKLCVLF